MADYPPRGNRQFLNKGPKYSLYSINGQKWRQYHKSRKWFPHKQKKRY